MSDPMNPPKKGDDAKTPPDKQPGSGGDTGMKTDAGTNPPKPPESKKGGEGREKRQGRQGRHE